MLKDIRENYDMYKEIHREVLPDLKDSKINQKAKILLENSLYLSIYTTFEKFLEAIIQNYLDKIDDSEKGITFTELTESIAKNLYFQSSAVENVNNLKKGMTIEYAFNKYFEFTRAKLHRKALEKCIKFKFLHGEALTEHYNDLFELLLGERDFLNNFKLEINNEHFNCLSEFGEEKIQITALNFLASYTDKIRNEIAHKNHKFWYQKFTIENLSLEFKDVTELFLQIIERIVKKYEEHTGFTFELKNKNLLSDYF